MLEVEEEILALSKLEEIKTRILEKDGRFFPEKKDSKGQWGTYFKSDPQMMDKSFFYGMNPDNIEAVHAYRTILSFLFFGVGVLILIGLMSEVTVLGPLGFSAFLATLLSVEVVRHMWSKFKKVPVSFRSKEEAVKFLHSSKDKIYNANGDLILIKDNA